MSAKCIEARARKAKIAAAQQVVKIPYSAIAQQANAKNLKYRNTSRLKRFIVRSLPFVSQ
jgi:hypothetical protein